ncbi:MAG: tripartite tricarboxylate transporter permease, partial [Xanthobacteraceae bacterium]
MADTLHNLVVGFEVVLAPSVLLYACLGCVIGTIVGVLPGLGPLAGISILLPLSFGLPPTTAIVLLAGIYYGAMYGGSTTSILMRIPGEAASVVTCIDGYEMTRQGRAGPALAIAAIGSFVAGTLSVVALMLLAPPLARLALAFGPPEYLALLLMGLTVLSSIGSDPMPKTLTMAALGLLLGTIGIDPMSGYNRFSGGIPELADGLGVVPLAVGLFGLSEIMLAYGNRATQPVGRPRLSELMPSREEARLSIGPVWRGTVIGFLIGIIPGSAHILSSFVSYAIERRLSPHPERFGKGAVEGVAGPESANNAAASGAFVPMLALGVPLGPVQAILIAVLIVHGIAPGPLLVAQQPQLFWGFIASMYVGNLVLLVLNLPLVGLFVW